MTRFKAKKLPPLPQSTNDYIASIRSKKPSSLEDVYDLITDIKSLDRQCYWILFSLHECFQLLRIYHTDSTKTESFCVNRVWRFIETVFDSSSVDCIIGEKSSSFSASDMNNNRTLGGEGDTKRKMMGRKVDWLFKSCNVELGCGEASKNEDSTKMLSDGSFKMPKVMKGMLYKLCQSQEIKQKISIPSFLVMDKTLFFKIMDCPGGYVCRINTLPSRSFPCKEIDVVCFLLPLLDLVLRTRLMMENNYEIYKEGLDISNEEFTSIATPTNVLPWFHIHRKVKRSS